MLILYLGVVTLGIRDFFDSFGSVNVWEQDGVVTITGINVKDFLADVYDIWANKKLSILMFRDIEYYKYRLVFDSFFVPDVIYQLEQIVLLKKRKSSKYRLESAHKQLLTETWFKSTTENHLDILDFTQLNRLKFKLLPTQIETMNVYNTKVPGMQLKGFLLGTPPGCLSGDTEIIFYRNGEEFSLDIGTAYRNYNGLSTNKNDNWDPSVQLYVKSYTGSSIELHPIQEVIYTGIQDVYTTTFSDNITIKSTYGHPFKTDTDYVLAQEIVGKSVMRHTQNNEFDFVTATSIRYYGSEPTYDIVCESPHHNFVANGIVVHNSGKTLMSIALSIMLHSDVTFFIVPKATVTTVWVDGIIEQFGHEVRVWSTADDDPLTVDYDYYVFHYEALEKAIEIAKELRRIKKRPFIAIDESHNMNEINSNRTMRLIEVSKILNCQHTVFATGTPVKALGLEMVPLLRTIDRLFTPAVEQRFIKIYGATAKRANDILRNRLGLISHKIIESDYMKIPPPIEETREVTIPKPDRFLIKNIKMEMRRFIIERQQFYRKNMKDYVRIYDEGISHYGNTIKTKAERDELRQYRDNARTIIEGYDPIAHRDIARFVKEFEQKKIIPSLPSDLKPKFRDATSVVKYLSLKVMGEFLGQLSKLRAECAVELAKYANLDEIVTGADKKTIIFSSFIPALEAANKYLNDRGFNTLRVYGDHTKNVTAIVNQFKTDHTTNPLLGTLQSIAASQTLIVANTAVFLDSPFRDYIYNQAIHRIFRIGQDCQTYTITLILASDEPNISTRSADILAWSQQQVIEIFGATTREDAVGIVKRLKLNPPASGAEQLFEMIRNIFGM